MLIMTMKRLQMNLNFLGYYCGFADGIKGVKTVEAIKKYQKDNNLKVDGIAGQKTIDSIRAKICQIQKNLNVTVDGVAGFETVYANNKKNSIIDDWSNIKHFKRSEFDCKCGCGLNNISLKIVKIADDVREHFNNRAIVTSGTRCRTHNQDVGGVSNSKHLIGHAIDMYVENVSWYDLLVYLKTLEKKGIIRYCYHIQNSNCCHFDIG